MHLVHSSLDAISDAAAVITCSPGGDHVSSQSPVGIAANERVWWGRGTTSQCDVTPSWQYRLPDSGKPERQSRAKAEPPHSDLHKARHPFLPSHATTMPRAPILSSQLFGPSSVMVREARHAVNHGKELSASSRSSYPSHRFPGWHFLAILKPPNTANQWSGTGMTAAGQRQYRAMRRKRGLWLYLSLYLSQGRRMPSIGNPRYWLCSCAAYKRCQRKRFNRR